MCGPQLCRGKRPQKECKLESLSVRREQLCQRFGTKLLSHPFYRNILPPPFKPERTRHPREAAKAPKLTSVTCETERCLVAKVGQAGVMGLPNVVLVKKGLLTGHLSVLLHNLREFRLISPSEEEHVNFSIEEVREHLKNKQIEISSGVTCLSIKCPKCSLTGVSRNQTQPENVLHINKTTGHILCIGCKLHGTWSEYKEYLNCQDRASDLAQYLHPVTSPAQNQKLDQIITMSQPVNSENVEALQRLKRVSAETLEKVGARTSLNSHTLLIPVTHPDGSLASFWKLDDESNVYGHAESFVPLVLRGKNNREDAVVVTNVEDALCAYQYLGCTVVCLPAGCKTLPQETLPYLESYRKLILWFGSGLEEREAVRTFSRKLFEERCYYIRPSKSAPSPSLAVAEGLSLSQILKSKIPLFHSAITTFTALKDEVYAEIIQKNEVAGVQWTRFPRLNDLLKGFRRGELTVFTGPTGSGKTTFMSEYSLDLCLQNVNTLWGSFEIKNVRLAKQMLTQFAGCSLEDNVERFHQYAKEFERLPLFFLTFHGEQDFESVMKAIKHATYVHDIGHVVIDNLQFMMGAGAGSAARLDLMMKQDYIIGELRRFATLHNVHVTVVIHPRKGEMTDELTTASIYGGAKATQEADNVMILQDRKNAGNGMKKYLQITKNRFSGELGNMPLAFNKESLSFQPKRKASKISWDTPSDTEAEADKGIMNYKPRAKLKGREYSDEDG